jgi:hypothetical protein
LYNHQNLILQFEFHILLKLYLAVPIFPPLAHAAAVVTLIEEVNSSVAAESVVVKPPKPKPAVMFHNLLK